MSERIADHEMKAINNGTPAKVFAAQKYEEVLNAPQEELSKGIKRWIWTKKLPLTRIISPEKRKPGFYNSHIPYSEVQMNGMRINEFGKAMTA